jgi:hypothetical protein
LAVFVVCRRTGFQQPLSRPKSFQQDREHSHSNDSFFIALRSFANALASMSLTPEFEQSHQAAISSTEKLTP